MPGPKRAAKIEAKRKRRAAAQHENHHEQHEDPSAQIAQPTFAGAEQEDEGFEDLKEDIFEEHKIDNWDDLHKDDLKEEAEERGLPTYGTKADIIKRLREYAEDQ